MYAALIQQYSIYKANNLFDGISNLSTRSNFLDFNILNVIVIFLCIIINDILRVQFHD